jgi:hypothetical protein
MMIYYSICTFLDYFYNIDTPNCIDRSVHSMQRTIYGMISICTISTWSSKSIDRVFYRSASNVSMVWFDLLFIFNLYSSYVYRWNVRCVSCIWAFTCTISIRSNYSTISSTIGDQISIIVAAECSITRRLRCNCASKHTNVSNDCACISSGKQVDQIIV